MNVALLQTVQNGCHLHRSLRGGGRGDSSLTVQHRLAFLCAVNVYLLTASLAWWLRSPPRERKIPGSNPAYAGIFPESSHTSGLKIGTPVAALPGAWRSRVSAGTGWFGVRIL